MRAWICGIAGLLLLAGCSSDVYAAEASAAAVTFIRSDRAQACSLLAPQTVKAIAADGDCGDRLKELELPASVEVLGVEVDGESAQVRTSEQVIFLARFPDGWRVTAAGCVREDPDPAVPYECQVEP